MLAQPTPHPPRRAFISSLTAVILASAGLGAHRAKAAAPEAIRQPDRRAPEAFVARAFEMRRQAVESGDQAYGAIVVRDNRIVGQSPSRVVLDRDPTAHAELTAIRDAAHRLGSRDLGGAILYSSSRACPMCEAAAYWAGIERLVYGSEGRDGGAPTLCG